MARGGQVVRVAARPGRRWAREDGRRIGDALRRLGSSLDRTTTPWLWPGGGEVRSFGRRVWCNKCVQMCERLPAANKAASWRRLFFVFFSVVEDFFGPH